MKRVVLLMIAILLLIPLASRGEEAIEETIKIGTLLPLSGWGATYGERLQKAYTMAMEEINAQGGVLGKKLELVIRDSQGKPPLAAREVKKLVEQEEVIALVGGWSSDIAWAIAKVVQEKKVPYLLDHPSSDKLTRQGFQYVFRIQPTWGMYPTALEDFLLKVVYPQENRKLRVAYLYIDNPFAQSVWEYGLKPFFRSHREEFDLVLVEPYQGVALDFRLLLLKVKAAHPDLVIFTSFLRDAILLAREAREVGIRPLIFSGVGAGHSAEDFIKEAGEAGEGYFSAAPWRGDMFNPQWETWESKWTEKYEHPPGELEAEAYSAIYVLARALEGVKSWDDVEKAREELTESLEEVDMDTVFGHVEFENFSGYTHQNRAYNLTALFQWQEGALFQVWPPTAAERPFFYPVDYQIQDQEQEQIQDQIQDMEKQEGGEQ